MNVLVIEDDSRIANLVELALTEDGHQVTCASDGLQGVNGLLSGQFDVALLDIFLPEIDGFQVLHRVRALSCTTPILVLTAVDAVPKIVQAFDLGADDYLVKPFILEILLARVNAIARRGKSSQPATPSVPGLTLNRGRRIAILRDREIALTRKQYELLEMLVKQTGSITTREQLVEAGWGEGADVKENTLEVYIHGLRSKLEGHDKQISIVTVHGSGYMLMLP